MMQSVFGIAYAAIIALLCFEVLCAQKQYKQTLNPRVRQQAKLRAQIFSVLVLFVLALVPFILFGGKV